MKIWYKFIIRPFSERTIPFVVLMNELMQMASVFPNTRAEFLKIEISDSIPQTIRKTLNAFLRPETIHGLDYAIYYQHIIVEYLEFAMHHVSDGYNPLHFVANKIVERIQELKKMVSVDEKLIERCSHLLSNAPRNIGERHMEAVRLEILHFLQQSKTLTTLSDISNSFGDSSLIKILFAILEHPKLEMWPLIRKLDLQSLGLSLSLEEYQLRRNFLVKKMDYMSRKTNYHRYIYLVNSMARIICDKLHVLSHHNRIDQIISRALKAESSI